MSERTEGRPAPATPEAAAAGHQATSARVSPPYPADAAVGDGHHTQAGDLEPGQLVLVAHGPGGLSLTVPLDPEACWRTVTAVEPREPCGPGAQRGVVVRFGEGAGDSVHVPAHLSVWVTEPW